MSETNDNQYTFEDWLHDDEQFEYRYYPQANDTLPFGKTGYYPYHLNKRGSISDEEYEKIKKAQREAYDLVVTYHVKKALSELHEEFQSVELKGDYLRLKKGEIEKVFEKATPDILANVYAGKWDEYRLDSISYRKIKEREKQGLPPLPLKGLTPNYLSNFGAHPEPTNIDGFFYCTTIDEHFHLTVQLQVYLEIKNLLENENDPLTHLVEEFSHEFSNSPRVKYSVQAISTYIRIWENKKTLPDFRKKAKSEAIKNCDELSSVRDGTFLNWEEKWKKFKESRTGK